MEQSMRDIEAMIAWAKENGDKDYIEAANSMKAAYEKTVSENPDGYWLGYHGKCNYQVFCRDARETVRHMKDRKWRVLKAEIDDGAKTWANSYYNGVENSGVLRYLYATM